MGRPLASNFGNNSTAGKRFKGARQGRGVPTERSLSAAVVAVLSAEGAVRTESERKLLKDLPLSAALKMLRETELSNIPFSSGAAVSFDDLRNTRGSIYDVVALALATFGLVPLEIDPQGRIKVGLNPGAGVGRSFSDFVDRLTAVPPSSSSLAGQTKVSCRMSRCSYGEVMFLMEACFPCSSCPLDSALLSWGFSAGCCRTRTNGAPCALRSP